MFRYRILSDRQTLCLINRAGSRTSPALGRVMFAQVTYHRES
jgi:hypothetical protein